jgi:hypothetical protein
MVLQFKDKNLPFDVMVSLLPDGGTPIAVKLQSNKNSSFKNYQKYRTKELQCPKV